jgi:hypothetical protein
LMFVAKVGDGLRHGRGEQIARSKGAGIGHQSL